MTWEERGELNPPCQEKGVIADKQRVWPLAPNVLEGCLDLADGAGLEDFHLQAHRARGRFHLAHRWIGIRRIGGIDEQRHTNCFRYDFAQELEPLRHQFGDEKVDAGRVAAGPGEAGDEAEPDRVFGNTEHDGNRHARRLHHGRQIIAAYAYNYRRTPADQIRCQCRQPVELIFRPTVFDRDILALAKAGLFQTFAKCAQAVRESIRRYRGEKSDHRHRPLLRARRERPRSRRAAEQRDELAALHSITSSALASSMGGISRPSAFATIRLITKSNLVGCSTGMSAS